MSSQTLPPQTLQWIGDETGHLRLIDQTRLPAALEMLDCQTVEQVWQAIRQLSVRGAPAIGIAAAYGVVLAAKADPSPAGLLRAIDYLATSRPTAVNLFWALDRMRPLVEASSPAELLNTAIAIHDDDRQLCRRIGQHGAPLLADCQGVITHCNAGGLATSEYGTALGVIYAAHNVNPALKVYADETRPLLQGARLTAWELSQAGVDVTVICDSMAAQVMREGRVGAVVVGADRIAANGDAANKIGTYGLAVLAKHHNIPFYVAAPHNTFDLTLQSGSEIPIEYRADEEITHPFGTTTVPAGVAVYNPAFDVTPAELIAAIITDKGVVSPEQITASLLV